VRDASDAAFSREFFPVTDRSSDSRSSDKDWQELPFGAFEAPPGYTPPTPKKAPPAVADKPVFVPIPDPSLPPLKPLPAPRANEPRSGEPRSNDARPNEDGGGRRGRRGRWRDRREGGGAGSQGAPAKPRGEPAPGVDGNGHEGQGRAPDAPRTQGQHAGPGPNPSHGGDGPPQDREGRRRRRRNRRQREDFQRPGDAQPAASEPALGTKGETLAEGAEVEPGDRELESVGAPTESAPYQDRRSKHGPRSRHDRDRGPAQQARPAPQVMSGIFVLEKGGFGFLRREESQYLPSKEDIFVSPQLVQRCKLRDGALVAGPCGKGNQSKHQLLNVDTVDGKDPREVANVVPFKKLTSIDPDFHYSVGDIQGDVSMRVLDVICPVGRGSRGLIVAPPRTGKTILMRKFANAITEGYPEVNLMVLLIDERPEEATEWKRTTKGQVFVSTNDEDTKNHVELAEIVFKRCQRLVELGQDVVLLLDSITRLARAYNNHAGTSGKTMSGGLDSRAMERPRSFFGMARNTETAGSLTILGTTLIETGSRLDQMVFEEFKGTGNLEIVLSRKLADRRIFPAIDIERSGTRKDEKLHSATRLRRIHTLRRVLLKMNFVEAMELLINKLEDVDKIDDFLKRFETDPEA
jgi:transcription termination factor Rho